MILWVPNRHILLYLYYRCTAAVIKGKRACPVRTVAADELEEFLIDKFKELGQNQKLLRKSIEKSNTLAKQGLAPLKRDMERTEAQLEKVNQELKQLIEFIKTQDLDKKRARGIAKEISDLEGSKEELETEIHRIETNMQHLNQHVIDADTFARLFREFPKVFETFSFDEKRNLILLLVKEVIYTPKRIKVLFWGDLPEMNLDLKNPPDWTPPTDEDGSYTPKGRGPSGVGALTRPLRQVRTRVSNGSPAWARTRDKAVTVWLRFPGESDFLFALPSWLRPYRRSFEAIRAAGVKSLHLPAIPGFPLFRRRTDPSDFWRTRE